MDLVWNTKQWLAEIESGRTPASSRVEFHFLSGRELYDEMILSPDRHHSSAGEWVLLPRPRNFYSVAVVSRPVYARPQELCLSFRCFSKEEKIGTSISIGPPIEEVALQFGHLLSVLVR
jgi:hypothetical protein